MMHLSPRFLRIVSGLLSLLLVGLLAWQLSRWVWLFFSPTVLPPPAGFETAPSHDTLIETIRNAHIFEAGLPQGNASEIVDSSLGLKLTGVFAAHGAQPAVAIIDTGAKEKNAFPLGAMIVKDVTLEAVHADHVILRRGGMRERLRLEQKTLPKGAVQEHEKGAPQ